MSIPEQLSNVYHDPTLYPGRLVFECVQDSSGIYWDVVSDILYSTELVQFTRRQLDFMLGRERAASLGVNSVFYSGKYRFRVIEDTAYDKVCTTRESNLFLLRYKFLQKWDDFVYRLKLTWRIWTT